MAIPGIDITSMNRPASEVKKEQEEEVYNKLYPKMVGDFIHKDDFENFRRELIQQLNTQNASIAKAFTDVLTQLNILAGVIGGHGHPVAGATASPIGIAPPVSLTYTGSHAQPTYSDIKANSYIDQAAVSGFDGSVEVRKRSVTRLTPPFSAEKL